jgi:diaminopimelate epimerase
VLKLHIDANNLVESVTVDMGEPVFEDKKLYKTPSNSPLDGENSRPILRSSGCSGEQARSREGEEGVFISMGNPHYVIFTDDIDQVGETGPVMEHHPMFPQRCNIEFATPTADGFRVRVWERGSGITQACGTGACATAVAAAKTGRAGRTSTIIMDGGTLSIEWSEADNHVYMTGPATFVFDGEITDN